MPIKKKQFIKYQNVPTEKEVKKSPDRYLDLDLPRRTIFFNNLIGGIAWGLGATVGASIVLALLGFILNQLHVVPIIGSFATDLGKYFPKK